MSFPHWAYYTIFAKREIYDCEELDPDFADLLFTDPYIYRNPESLVNTCMTDKEHELAIKLTFLCDMRQEYNDNFFGGNAPITETFFDRWWTLVKCDDGPENIESVLKRIRTDDFDAICQQFPAPLTTRFRKLRDTTSDPEEL